MDGPWFSENNNHHPSTAPQGEPSTSEIMNNDLSRIRPRQTATTGSTTAAARKMLQHRQASLDVEAARSSQLDKGVAISSAILPPALPSISANIVMTKNSTTTGSITGSITGSTTAANRSNKGCLQRAMTLPVQEDDVPPVPPPTLILGTVLSYMFSDNIVWTTLL